MNAPIVTYAISLLMGVVVGVLYALVGIRSPAPPLIALIGLLGIVLGEEGTAFVKHWLDPPPATKSIPRPAPPDRSP